jgi:hypothetical protein
MPTRSAEDYLRYQLVLAKTDNMVDVVESYFTWRALSTLSKCLHNHVLLLVTRVHFRLIIMFRILLTQNYCVLTFSHSEA